MDCLSREVALVRCCHYQQEALKIHIDALCRALGFTVRSGERVLLKPNLVSASGHQGNAVTHPDFVAAVAAWCVDQGGLVSIGDSPAFGSACHVMHTFGFAKALKGLPVTLINFKKKKQVKTQHGFPLVIAAEIDECDHLINLPKIKAHSQLRLTMAVKNYFGAVIAWRKALAHMRHGDKQFMRLIIDLLDVLPEGISIADGVTAMHRKGPVGGEGFGLAVMGASPNPIALDRAIIDIVGAKPEKSPLWREANNRRMVGCDIAQLLFPLAKPAELAVSGFEIPAELSPVRFQVHSFLINSIKKVFRD